MQVGSVAVAWLDHHTLVTASDKEAMLRLFNFESQDNYALDLKGHTTDPRKTCALRWSGGLRMLAAATSDGCVTFFHFNPPEARFPPVFFSILQFYCIIY